MYFYFQNIYETYSGETHSCTKYFEVNAQYASLNTNSGRPGDRSHLDGCALDIVCLHTHPSLVGDRGIAIKPTKRRTVQLIVRMRTMERPCRGRSMTYFRAPMANLDVYVWYVDKEPNHTYVNVNLATNTPNHTSRELLLLLLLAATSGCS